jgi:putative transposase
VTFTCYHRRRGFDSPAVYDLFLQVLEEMRRHFALCVYGYVIMPEHVHLLLSEPQRGLLADAMHYLKLSFAKRLVVQVLGPVLGANLGHSSGVFWQKRATCAMGVSLWRSCAISIAIR